MLLNSHEKHTDFMYFWVLFEIMIIKCLKFRKYTVLQLQCGEYDKVQNQLEYFGANFSL